MAIDSEIMKLLKELGYTPDQGVAEFWLNNRDVASRLIDAHYPNRSQSFDLEVRWHSEIGRSCQEAIVKHIKDKQKSAIEDREEEIRSQTGGKLTFPLRYADLSFDDFSFSFDSKMLRLVDFTQKYPTISHVSGIHDLRGIDLRGIRICDSLISNAFFDNGHFEGATLQQVLFKNCNFVHAHFKNARLVSIRMDDRTRFGDAHCEGAFINAISFTRQNLGSPLHITKISYWQVIRYLTAVIFARKRVSNMHLNRWTDLLMVDVTAIDNPDLTAQREYVNWYQSLMRKINTFRTLPLTEKTSLVLSSLTTKYWSSYWVLLWTGFLINVVFSAIYYWKYTSFKNLNAEWFSAFYYSVVTFTTLGYGDISPRTHLAMALVTIEVLLGYILLGCLIFLVGRKVSNRY